MDNFATLFQNPPYPPNTFCLRGEQINTAAELFNFIFDLYKEGCVQLFGARGNFLLANLTEERQFIMKQYLRSCGILPKIWKYTQQDIHDVYERFDIILQQKDVALRVQHVKTNNLIHAIRFRLPVPKKEKMQTLETLLEIIKNDDDFINVMNITIDKDNMTMYKGSVKIDNTLYVLRFFWENLGACE